MTKLTKAALAFSVFLFAGCVSSQDRAAVNVDYYNVQGTSFEELDRQIALHGPTVAGVGRAIASARIRMVPDIRYTTRSGKCRVSGARVSVIADITLPRLADRNKVDGDLRNVFSNIEEYARLHEAVHVDIAERYAERAENRISSLKPRPDCDALKENVQSTFASVMQEHEAAQQAFDARERRRFASS